MRTLSTIGYEGADLEQFIAELKRAGIQQLLDVRDLPLSRKRGFSKNAFSAALAAASISYTHLRALGDPKPGRDAMRAGKRDEFTAIFNAHMERPEAKSALDHAFQLATRKPSVLLCYEADHRCCHRLIVAERLAQMGKLSIRHLSMSCTSAPKRRTLDAGAYAFG